jgi:glycosyltransferase involved in cell wall biosynthesis
VTNDSQDNPFILILKNGPIYSLDDQIEYQLRVLSRCFQGELWATGPIEGDFQVGRFRVFIAKEHSKRRWAFFFAYYLRVARRARRLFVGGRRRAVVLTYDPFRNGLLGSLIKFVTGWPLIVEVNGVYGDPDNYIDSRGVLAHRIKPSVLRFIGRRVLRIADGVKLLYKEQLTGFAQVPSGTPVRIYFDSVPLDRFSPHPSENICLLVGFPFFRKGVDILLDAFGKLHEEFPDWKLVLLGHDLARHLSFTPHYVTVARGSESPGRGLDYALRDLGAALTIGGDGPRPD